MPPLAGRRVLVVEDNYLLALDLAEMLERAGAEIAGPVMSVQEAFDALDPPPDIATLDVQLGEETSFSIADELVRREVPFVFFDWHGRLDPYRASIPATLSKTSIRARYFEGAY